MRLLDFLMMHGGTYVFYRVMASDPGGVEAQIRAPEGGLDSPTRAALAAGVCSLLGGEASSDEVFLFKTEGRPYPAREDDHMIDIAVFSADLLEGKRAFARELLASAERQARLLDWYRDEVQPFLHRLSEDETVRGIILRGHLVSPHRWATPGSDVDLFILVDFEQTDVAQRGRMYRALRGSPGRVLMDFTWVDHELAKIAGLSEDGEVIYDSEVIKDAPGEPTVEYSVFPLPDFYRLIDSGRFQPRKYMTEAVLHTEVVFERDGEARRFLKAVLDLR